MGQACLGSVYIKMKNSPICCLPKQHFSPNLQVRKGAVEKLICLLTWCKTGKIWVYELKFCEKEKIALEIFKMWTQVQASYNIPGKLGKVSPTIWPQLIFSDVLCQNSPTVGLDILGSQQAESRPEHCYCFFLVPLKKSAKCSWLVVSFTEKNTCQVKICLMAHLLI